MHIFIVAMAVGLIAGNVVGRIIKWKLAHWCKWLTWRLVIFALLIPATRLSILRFLPLRHISIPYGIRMIDPWMFEQNDRLHTISIPNSVTEIGNGAFRDCTRLRTISISDSVIAIGEGAFCHCTSLETITIPGGVTEIGNGAFYGCTNLHSISIPEHLEDGVRRWDLPSSCCVDVRRD